MDGYAIVVSDCPYHDNSTVLGVYTDWEKCFGKLSETTIWKETFNNYCSLWSPTTRHLEEYDYFPKQEIATFLYKYRYCYIGFFERGDPSFDLSLIKLNMPLEEDHINEN